MKQIILFSLLSSFLWIGCEKGDNTSVPTKTQNSDILIELQSPSENAEIEIGSDMSVVVFISDALSLHEYTIELLGEQGEQYLYDEGHTHFPEITLKETWLNMAPKGSRIELKVQASNHSGEVLKKSFFFYSVQ